VALLRVGGRVEVTGRTLPRVHAHPHLFRVFAFVHGDAEPVGDRFGFVDRVIDPAIPAALLVHENELRVVQADPDDYGLRLRSARHEIARQAHPFLGFALAFEGPSPL
jgi:hypothetical protein